MTDFLLKLLVVLFLTVILCGTVAYATEEVTVILDGNKVDFDVKPTIINGRTMVPIRNVFEAFGAEVTWTEETKTIVGKKCGITVIFSIDNVIYYKNTISFTSDVAPLIINGRTLIPLRVLAESFGSTVEWNNETKTVALTSSNKLQEIPFGEGYIYFGETENELANGYGTIVNVNENYRGVCSGIFADGEIIYGTYWSYAEDGSFLYTSFGEFSDFLLNGNGYEVYNDDSVYIGEFYNGYRDGWGTYTWENDEYFIGTFSGGEIVSGTFYNADGTVAYSVPTTQPSYSSDDTYVSSWILPSHFPLYLYSNDMKTYLGELTSNKYKSESVLNEYGSYGSKYSSTSIFNSYGTYGSKYSSESAFNEYASKPPVIVDKDGNIIGYLTANKYKTKGISWEEMIILLNQYGK